MSGLDDSLAELASIREHLATLADDDPARAGLEARRSDIQRRARQLADSSRNPEYLAKELAHLESRLAALEDHRIKESLSERRPILTDPSAYASTINRKIDEANQPEIVWLEQRIAELRQALGLSPAEDPPNARNAE